MNLTIRQIAELRKVKRYRRWLDQHALVRHFMDKYGRFPRSREEFPAGNRLGRWYNDTNRTSYRKGHLKLWQVDLLKEFNYQFEPPRHWELNFKALAKGWKEHPDSWPYVYYYTPNLKRIEMWCRKQREYFSNGTLSPDKIKLLESINFVWQPPGDVSWQNHYEAIASWISANNRCPKRYSEDPREVFYARWISKERSKANLGRISRDRSKKVEALCRLAHYNPVKFDWEDSLSLCRNWCARHNRRPNKRSANPHEKRLGHWLQNQKRSMKLCQLPTEKSTKLTGLLKLTYRQ